MKISVFSIFLDDLLKMKEENILQNPQVQEYLAKLPTEQLTTILYGPQSASLVSAYNVIEKGLYEALADPENSKFGVVFDLDDTLVGPQAAFSRSWHETYTHFTGKDHPLKDKSPVETTRFIRPIPRKERFSTSLFGELDKNGQKNNPDIIEAHHDALLLKYYKEETSALPGAEAALRVLNKMKDAGMPLHVWVGSANQQVRVSALVDKLGWMKYFESVNGDVPGGKSKLKEDFGRYVFDVDNGGVIPKNLAIIGDDHDKDGNMAENFAKYSRTPEYQKNLKQTAMPSAGTQASYIAFNTPILETKRKLSDTHPTIESWDKGDLNGVDMFRLAAASAVEKAIKNGVIKESGGKQSSQRVVGLTNMTASLKAELVKSAVERLSRDKEGQETGRIK